MSNFTEKEQLVGWFTTISGSVVVADGINADTIPGRADQRVVLDLGKEKTRIPIYASKQHGHRFLLIPIDAAESLTSNPAETVQIENPAPLPKKETKASGRPQSQ